MHYNLAGIGEVLWDLLPEGRQLGGAPANFAYHAFALGAVGRIISRVGQDENGREIIQRLEKLGVLTDCIEIDSEAPTGTVTVQVSPSGQPQYTIQENVAWDRLAGEANARRAIQEADAVCFGTLAQRSETSRKAIEILVGLTRPDALRVFDVNLRQHYYSPERIESSLHKSNVLKVNDGELPEIAAFFGIAGNVTRQMEELAKRFELRTVACTRGEDGSVLLSEGRWSEHPGIPAKVVDTVGAGDSFTAAMVLGLLAGWDLDLINERANRVAAWVASHPGATPPLSNELRLMFAT